MAPNDNVAFNNYSLNYTLFFPLSKNAKGGRRGRSTSRPAIKRARKDTSRREDLSVTPRDRSGVRDAEQVDKLKTTSKKMQVRYIKFIYAGYFKTRNVQRCLFSDFPVQEEINDI